MKLPPLASCRILQCHLLQGVRDALLLERDPCALRCGHKAGSRLDGKREETNTGFCAPNGQNQAVNKFRPGFQAGSAIIRSAPGLQQGMAERTKVYDCREVNIVLMLMLLRPCMPASAREHSVYTASACMMWNAGCPTNAQSSAGCQKLSLQCNRSPISFSRQKSILAEPPGKWVFCVHCRYTSQLMNAIACASCQRADP